MKFAIAIPTVNRADLLVPALNKYATDFSQTMLYVYDNGAQGISSAGLPDNFHILTGENLGVAGAWNHMLHEIFKNHDYALVLNDDIELGRPESEISALIQNHKDADFISTMYDWSAFILPKKTFMRIGPFDTDFYPAYCEDSDYEYRMKLAGCKHVKTVDLFPKNYRVSMTSHKDPKTFSNLFAKSKVIYRRKWGGEPKHEKFKTPYNKQ